jgi:hypothetical protein
VTRSVVLPAQPNDRCRSTARVFLSSFVSFSSCIPTKADRAEEQVGNGAWVLGEACGVDRSLTVELGACLPELSPAFTESLADAVWHVHLGTAVKLPRRHGRYNQAR